MSRPTFPYIDWDFDPAADLGHEPEDMIGLLWDTFNNFPQPVLSLDAWRYEVQDASRQAGDTDDFRRILAAKRNGKLLSRDRTLERERQTNPGESMLDALCHMVINHPVISG